MNADPNEFSVYSVFVYVNTENVSLAFPNFVYFTTFVYFLSTSFILQTSNSVSYMILYGLLSNTYIDNLSFFASDLSDQWSLFYIETSTKIL